MAFGFAGAAAGGADALQQLLTERRAAFLQQEQIRLQQEAAQRQAEQFASRLRQDQSELGVREMQMQADNADRAGQRDRQAKLDDVAAGERRQATNQQGVKRMLGEFLVQRGAQPLDAGSRQTMQGMALQEGVDLPANIASDPEIPHKRAIELENLRHRNDLSQISAQGEQSRRTAAAGRTAPPPTPGLEAGDTLALLDQFEKHPGTPKAYGIVDSKTAFLDQDAQDAIAMRDQLVAALSLPNMGVLKGPASDNDVRFIKTMSSRLSNPNISDAGVKQAVTETRAYLTRRQAEESGMGRTGGGGGGGGTVRMRAPDGRMLNVPAAQVEAAKARGAVVQ